MAREDNPWRLSRVLVCLGFTIWLAAAGTALAQKQGGVLRQHIPDNPASLSIHEESTVTGERPAMPIFNNLVLFDQSVARNSMASIVPDLAETWSWNEDGTKLTFRLRQGVKWHDGKPFTSADVKCTWDMLRGLGAEKLRINPRRSWYDNLVEVTVPGPYEAVFVLKRRQPAFLALLATGMSPVYPCHVSPAAMRQQPVGTGPFKFAEFKPNESIKLVRNPDYWKPGRPYLDGIEYELSRSRSTAILAFIAGKYDLTFAGVLTVPLTRDLQKQRPDAICELPPGSVSTNLIVNRLRPPFDNPEIRKAMALVLDRRAFVEILSEGQGNLAIAMQPMPGGLWGTPPEMLSKMPGYGTDIAERQAKAVEIMKSLGYGPGKRLAVKVSTRDVPPYRDPAIILIDQLKTIFIDGELEVLDTTQWFPKVLRKDYSVALNLTGTFVDDPDAVLYENFSCGGQGNYNAYCDKDIEALIDRQSMERDQDKRREIVWEIERRLLADDAKPLIQFNRAGVCWDPAVKGLTVNTNSIYNGWRMEDVWLNR